jgi:hypothetical protein
VGWRDFFLKTSSREEDSLPILAHVTKGGHLMNGLHSCCKMLVGASMAIGLTGLAVLASGCSSYANNGRFAHYANDDIEHHPEAKQDIETLLSASNDDVTERAVLCVHSVYEAEATTTPIADLRAAKTDAVAVNEKPRADIEDPSSFSFAKKSDDRLRSCLKLCTPSPSEVASPEVRTIAKKYSDRCRTHFGELRTLSAD